MYNVIINIIFKMERVKGPAVFMFFLKRYVACVSLYVHKNQVQDSKSEEIATQDENRILFFKKRKHFLKKSSTCLRS